MPSPAFALSAAQDAIWIAFSFDTQTSSAPTNLRDGRYGLSVARTSAGLYTVTLPKPYPAQLIACVPAGLAIATGQTNDQQVRYVKDSYSATAGTFQLMILLDDGTPAIGEAATAGDEIHVVAVFNRKAILNQ